MKAVRALAIATSVSLGLAELLFFLFFIIRLYFALEISPRSWYISYTHQGDTGGCCRNTDPDQRNAMQSSSRLDVRRGRHTFNELKY